MNGTRISSKFGSDFLKNLYNGFPTAIHSCAIKSAEIENLVVLFVGFVLFIFGIVFPKWKRCCTGKNQENGRSCRSR
jgi:hypothetical protein